MSQTHGWKTVRIEKWNESFVLAHSNHTNSFNERVSCRVLSCRVVSCRKNDHGSSKLMIDLLHVDAEWKSKEVISLIEYNVSTHDTESREWPVWKRKVLLQIFFLIRSARTIDLRE